MGNDDNNYKFIQVRTTNGKWGERIIIEFGDGNSGVVLGTDKPHIISGLLMMNLR